MKMKWAAMLVAFLCAASLAFGQDASTDKQSAGSEMKNAAKTSKVKTEKGAKTAGKDTEMGPRKLRTPPRLEQRQRRKTRRRAPRRLGKIPRKPRTKRVVASRRASRARVTR